MKVCMYVCSLTQLCLSLCNPMNCSPSGSSVHGIFWARIIEWVAISFFRASFLARDWICVSACPSLQVDSLPLSHPHEGWGDVDKLLHIHFFAIILISEITGCLLLLCCSLEFPWVTFISFKLFIFYCFCGRCKLWDLLLFHFMPGAGMRTSTRGKGHKEGGSTYAKAGSSLRSSLEILEHLPPKPQSAYFTTLCSHLHLWL